jgi:glycerol uptake facilitator-like aquaporin
MAERLLRELAGSAVDVFSWVNWLGPVVGAALGALLNEALRAPMGRND